MEISRLLDKDGNVLAMSRDGKPIDVTATQQFIENRKQRREAQTMTKEVRVLLAPKMKWEKSGDDRIGRVQEYLETLHGKEEARERLRKMSGLEVLELSDRLKNDKAGDPPTDANGNQLLLIPKMDWGKKPK